MTQPTEKPVLILSGHGSIRPAVPMLAADYDLLFIDPQGMQVAAEMGVSNVAALQQFVEPDLREMASNTAAMLTARAVNGLPEIAARFNAIYRHGQPALLNSQMSGWFAGYAAFNFGELILQLSALEKLYSMRRVAGVVVHEDLTPLYRSAILHAKAKGVPTIHVPHAACHLLPSASPDIHRETRTDYIAASGDYMAQWYAANGFPLDKITVTGAPQFDGWYKGGVPGRDEARRVLGVEGMKRVICYATTWAQTTSTRSPLAEQEQTEGLAATIKLAKAMDAALIIKCHPSETPDNEKFYVAALEQSNVAGMVTRNHIGYILAAADVLVAQGPSNLCVEAAIVGTPSIYLRTEGFDFVHQLPYRATPDTLMVEAGKALDSRGSDEWRNFAAYYNAAHPDGEAAVKLADMVRQLCPI